MFATWVDQDQRFAFGRVAGPGAVEISVVDHAALIAGQSQGKVIVRGPDGRPQLADPPPFVPSIDQIRAFREQAYRSESDPLKLEAEYDALVTGVEPNFDAWVAKVAEIKQRYPLPE